MSAAGLFDVSTHRLGFLGRSETFRVVAVSGNILSISTDPTIAGVGLEYDYPAGAPVEQVRVRRYEVKEIPNSFPYRPFLAMTDSHETYLAEWAQMVSGNIENLQLTRDGYSIIADVAARAQALDARYTHPTEQDHYRRVNLAQRVLPRNARSDF